MKSHSFWSRTWKSFWQSFWSRSWWQKPHYYGFKVLAVIMALLVWGSVTVNQNPLTEATFSIPVEIRNLDESLAQPETNYQVQVRVQGTAQVISSLSSYDIEAFVDLSGMKAGDATPVVTLELPPNVSLLSRSPESIHLVLESKVSQTFPVEVRINGQPAEDCSLLEPVVLPEMITLYGSESRIEQVGSVYAVAEVSGLSSNYRKSLAVEVLNKEGENITSFFSFSPTTVAVMVPVISEQPEAWLPVRASVIGEPASGCEVSRVLVEPATVQVFGHQSLLDQTLSLETEKVDISGLASTVSFTTRLIAPEGVTLAQDTVMVVVQIEEVTEKELDCRVRMDNLHGGLSAKCSASATVTMSGTPTYLSALGSTDVDLYVDLSGISEPGEYTLPLEITPITGVEIKDIEPSSVQVTVSQQGAEQ